MSLRIAFDLDGTIADMQAALRDRAEQLFGADVIRRPVRPAGDASRQTEDSGENSDVAVPGLALDAGRQMRLWDHVKTVENFWVGLPETESGIVARIAATARARRWEVIFLTTRPPVAGEPTQLQSQRWLEAHGFQYPSVFVVQNSRGQIAAALQLDAVVDDRIENCRDVAVDSTAKSILIWHGEMNTVPATAKRRGVRVVASISEALALLEQLDELERDGGVVTSIKKLLGRSLV